MFVELDDSSDKAKFGTVRNDEDALDPIEAGAARPAEESGELVDPVRFKLQN
jgi:hypothetical protein